MNPLFVDRIRKMVSDEWRVRVEEVQLDTKLEEDLGMTGDDAAEFLEKFAKEFEVDFTGFDFHKHFGPEGCNPLWYFYTPAWLADHGKYPVTVDHLARVAEMKRWFTPARVG